jgi:hypothetical protein
MEWWIQLQGADFSMMMSIWAILYIPSLIFMKFHSGSLLLFIIFLIFAIMNLWSLVVMKNFQHDFTSIPTWAPILHFITVVGSVVLVIVAIVIILKNMRYNSRI